MTPPPGRPPPSRPPLIQLVGTTTYGSAHPDRDHVSVMLRLDPTLDREAVLARLVEAVRDLDLELRTAHLEGDPP